ncbi:hypothetical protein C7R87_0859 [Acinetobacter baumannii]|nr:hypothetical protein C7R87_0859 [Acinetobacter baumannii]
MQRTCQLSITFFVKSNTQFEQIGCALGSKIKSCTKNCAFQNKKAPFIKRL